MKKQASGVVISVTTHYWLKINTKAVRTSALDGAIFPHTVTAEYTVDGQSYKARRWLAPSALVPAAEGSRVSVEYEESKPHRGKILL